MIHEDGEHITSPTRHTGKINPKIIAEEFIDSKERLYDIINFLPDATFVIDSGGHVIAWNHAIEDMTHVKAENILGKGRYEYSIPFYGKRRKLLIDLALSSSKKLDSEYYSISREQKSITAEIYIPSLNGKPTYLWGKATTLYNKKGMIVGAIESIRDITSKKKDEIELKQCTEHKNTEEKLKKLNEKLKRSNAELEQYASVASHDLREPLRMIKSFLELLEDKYAYQLNDEAKSYINYAVDGAKHLDSMIIDLLDYSRVGQKEIKYYEVDCKDVLKKTLLNLKSSIDENNAVITYDGLPVITGNKNQMVELFQNLIGNSIKYRDIENPKIHISAKKKEDKFLFSVKDNGIGISKKDLERIFVIFQRLHTWDEYEGTGIGLAIAQKIVMQHGGKIWVESKPGHGTVFYFIIPE
jgi:PAS domain S-box-containing protein